VTRGRKLLTATMACWAIVTTTGWVVFASNMQEQADPSPVIHGSVDITIAPTPMSPAPDRALPGYPIDRWRQLQEASK